MDQGVRERDAECSLNKLLRLLVAHPMCHREWHEDQEREQHNEMLARAKEFVGDDDKLLVEYQHDIDIDIGIEAELPKLEFDQEFDQELNDCVEVPRRVSRQVLRRESLRESLRAWLRVQVCLGESLRGSFREWLRVCIQVCLHAERECCVMALVKAVESRQMRLQEDARADCPHQCCSEQGKYKCRQRQFHHAVDANHTVEVWKTTSSYNGCRQGKTSRIVASWRNAI